MKNCGIVSEYNPFHNGHKYHLRETAKITGCENMIAVMSGNFVERGEPAICDKISRTKAAILNGVDLVIELPVYFATSSAERFAHYAVSILNSSGICDCICFGSESGDIRGLSGVSEQLAEENPGFKLALKSALETGVSFPKAREKAISSSGLVVSKPNDILAVEYLKALKKLNSVIKPFTVKRIISDYGSKELTGDISSATAIRNALLTGSGKNTVSSVRHAVPHEAFNALNSELTEFGMNSLENYLDIIKYKVTMLPKNELKEINEVTEGLENRLKSLVLECFTVNELVLAIKSKRYTYTKIQRMLLSILLDIKKEEIRSWNLDKPQYIRVLGFREQKKHLLSMLSKKSSVPVIVNASAYKKLDAKSRIMFEKEIQSTEIYNIGLKKPKPKQYELIAPCVKL